MRALTTKDLVRLAKNRSSRPTPFLDHAYGAADPVTGERPWNDLTTGCGTCSVALLGSGFFCAEGLTLKGGSK